MTSSSPVVVQDHKRELMPGVHEWNNVHNGFNVIDLEYIADPEKRSDEWRTSTFSGMPRSEREREYGSTWTVYEGKPVYADYDEATHVARGTIIAPRRSKLISGWDGGPNDVYLAWALGLVYVDSLAVTFIDEYYVDDGDIYGFVEVVASRLRLEWAKLGGFSLHFVDQSVFTKSNVVKGGKAMSDVMREFGMPPIPGETTFAKRRIAVEGLLTRSMRWTNNEMIPRFRVHERCEGIRNAMKGGYAYPKAVSGVGNIYKPLPLKNEFSHIANAVEYACSRISLAQSGVPYENRRLPVHRMLRV